MVVLDEAVMVVTINFLETLMVVLITVGIVTIVKVKTSIIQVIIEVIMVMEAARTRVATIMEMDLEMVVVIQATIKISQKERITILNKEKLGNLKVFLKILRKWVSSLQRRNERTSHIVILDNSHSQVLLEFSKEPNM